MGNSGSNTARAVRLVVALVAVSCFVLGGALTGAYLAVRHIVTNAAIDYAKALGIALEPAEVRFGLSFVQLLDCRMVALQIPGVHATVRRIDIDLSGLRPKRVLISGVNVEAEGDPVALKDATLRYWEQFRPRVDSREVQLPRVEWQHLAVHVTTGNPLLPTLSITELTVETNVGPTRDETTIRTGTTRAGVLDLGALEFAFRYEDGGFEMGWGPTLLESSWRLAYRELGNAEELRFSFQPRSAKELLERLGTLKIPEAFSNAKVAGHVEAIRDQQYGKTTGTLTLNLDDFVPPYPPELKGYRFASTTKLRAQFEIDPLWMAAELRGIELRTGDLALTGHGRIDRELFSAHARVELGTVLDCVTLAKGYAIDSIGGALGQWGANNAPKAIRGGVSVQVQIDADSSRLDEAKVVKRMGIGCGLRPMSLTDLLNLGLPPIPDPKTVERLIQQVPPEAAISNLSALPKLLPTFDELLEAATRRDGKTSTPRTAPKRLAPQRPPTAAHSAAK